ncbi:hypothetical protein [Methylorubrum extorquens]|uniref:hypothetical protein n=1 Tax=Methylorubrum extorquens TaxID=408 RepID=UPI00209D4BD7|nr:hypothetical protein [Methylorubrum extorquens]MCP1538809.1 hypothetical protein [Methylorubrum extorquens]
MVVCADPSQIFLFSGNQGDASLIAAFSRKECTSFRGPSDVPLQAPHTLQNDRLGALGLEKA